MRTALPAALAPSIRTARSCLRLDEESFGSILTSIVRLLYPPPKTAAHIAALIGCTERNAELCIAGSQKWSGDAVAAIVSEVLARHAMRTVKVIARNGPSQRTLRI